MGTVVSFDVPAGAGWGPAGGQTGGALGQAVCWLHGRPGADLGGRVRHGGLRDGFRRP